MALVELATLRGSTQYDEDMSSLASRYLGHSDARRCHGGHRPVESLERKAAIPDMP